MVGDYDNFPCLNQEVTVAIQNDTNLEQFILGIVIEVHDNMLQILTDDGTHSIHPKDIFLTEKQMKQLKNSDPFYLCPNENHTESLLNGFSRSKRSFNRVIPSSPQPCCSSSIMNGRKLRMKRRCTEKSSHKLESDVASKSDNSSESETEDNTKNFNSLESVEGVQPELQLTQRELDINSKIYKHIFCK